MPAASRARIKNTLSKIFRWASARPRPWVRWWDGGYLGWGELSYDCSQESSPLLHECFYLASLFCPHNEHWQKILGEEARSHQHQETHANPTDTRGTVEKQTHSNFERRSHQHACFLDCPRARCERTPCLLELNFQNAAFSNVLQTPTRTNRLRTRAWECMNEWGCVKVWKNIKMHGMHRSAWQCMRRCGNAW